MWHIGRRRRALDQYAIALLVAYAELTQYSEAFYVKIVDVFGKAAEEKSLLLIQKHALQILEGDFSFVLFF